MITVLTSVMKPSAVLFLPFEANLSLKQINKMVRNNLNLKKEISKHFLNRECHKLDLIHTNCSLYLKKHIA